MKRVGPEDPECDLRRRNRPDSAVTDGWIVQDADGVIIDLVSRDDTIFGWAPADVLHDAALSLVHPDDRAIVWKARNRVRTDGGIQPLHIRVRAQNGRWLWVEVVFRAVRTPDGEPGLLTGATLRDVSDLYVEREAMALLIDLRQLIASASTISDAWQFGLDRLGRLASFTGALVWERASVGLSATNLWRLESTEVDHPEACDECQAAVHSYIERAWHDGDPIWVARPRHECLAGDDSTGEVLLVPTLSAGDVIAVVEFRGRRADDSHGIETQLIAEVVGQLGDAVRRKTAETELKLARRRFELAFSEASIGMALVAPDGSFVEANDALCKLLERSVDELRAIGFQAVTHPDDLEVDVSYVNKMLAGEISTYQMEKRYIRPDGAVVWGLLSVSLVRDEADVPVHFISQIQDITSLKEAESQLERSMARFRAAFDDSALGMALVSIDRGRHGVIAEANEEIQRICGEGIDDLVGQNVDVLVDHDPEGTFFASMLELASDDPTLRAEMPAKRTADGQRWLRLVAAPVRHDNGDPARFVVLQVEDITEQRRIHAEMSHLALHDSLTGLPNRALMLDRIRRAQERSERSQQHVGLLFIDLDNFKDVNDMHGHRHGDRLLEGVADRFRAVLGNSDSAARLGGDEFVILCEDLDGDRVAAKRELAAIADRLHHQLVVPLEVEGSRFCVTASIGSHVSRGLRESVGAVLSNADTAMYQAKALGRSRTEIYDESLPEGGGPTPDGGGRPDDGGHPRPARGGRRSGDPRTGRRRDTARLDPS